MSSLFVKSETRVKPPLLSKSEGINFFTFSEGINFFTFSEGYDYTDVAGKVIS
jgi:hypothetical protein